MRYIIPLLLIVLLAGLANAHETVLFEIDNQKYQFVIGSEGEPVYVDEVTAVEVVASRLFQQGQSKTRPSTISDIHETLQVEVIAGNHSKVLDFKPVHGQTGKYRAYFVPTTSTQYIYRLFGTLDNNQFDLSFTCAHSHHMGDEHEEFTPVTENGISILSKTGSFGCPKSRIPISIPEVGSTAAGLEHDMHEMMEEHQSIMQAQAGIESDHTKMEMDHGKIIGDHDMMNMDHSSMSSSNMASEIFSLLALLIAVIAFIVASMKTSKEK